MLSARRPLMLNRLFGHPGFLLLLLVLSLLLFNWPLLSIFNDGSGLSLFVSLFAAWGILILILAAVGSGSRSTEGPDKGGRP